MIPIAKKFLDTYFVETLSALSGVFVLGGFAWAFFVLHSLGGGPLILHFNDLDGITSIGGISTIVFMGAFGALVVLMNFFIAREFAARDRFFARFLAVMTLAFAILLFISFVAILMVNV